MFNYVSFIAVKTLLFLLIAIGCCVSIVVVLDKLETLDEKNINPIAMEFAPLPKKGSAIYYVYKDYKSVKRWTQKIADFLKRKLLPIFLPRVQFLKRSKSC